MRTEHITKEELGEHSAYISRIAELDDEEWHGKYHNSGEAKVGDYMVSDGSYIVATFPEQTDLQEILRWTKGYLAGRDMQELRSDE